MEESLHSFKLKGIFIELLHSLQSDLPLKLDCYYTLFEGCILLLAIEHYSLITLNFIIRVSISGPVLI